MTIFDINTQQLKTSIHLFKGEVGIERAETKALLNWIISSETITKDERTGGGTGTCFTNKRSQQ